MASNAKIGYGADLLKGDGATPTEAFATFGVEITNITLPGMSRDSVDVTHMASPDSAREFIAGLIDAGSFSMDINYVPAVSDVVLTAIQAEKGNWRIQFDSDIAMTMSAFCTEYTPTAPLDDKMTATVTWKVSGIPTMSDESA